MNSSKLVEIIHELLEYRTEKEGGTTKSFQDMIHYLPKSGCKREISQGVER